MAARTTLYCAESHSLKLGPGTGGEQVPGQLIVFRGHYAEFDSADFPDWPKWLVGAPHIEVLDESHGEIPADVNSEFVCVTCGKAFETKNKLNGHRMSHRPKETA